MLKQIGIGNTTPPRPIATDQCWPTFDRWNYFQHVNAEAIRDGWYDDLGKLQGRDRTWYVGGATSFELIEPIVSFSKDIVQRHFPGPRIWFPIPWCKVALALAAVLALLAVVFLPPAELDIPLPISSRSPGARAATTAYWTAFHAQRYEQLPSIIANLEVANRADPNDPVVSSVLGAAHLWRFMERRRVNGRAVDLQGDLVQTRALSESALTVEIRANEQTSIPSTFSPAMHAVAGWELGRLHASQPEIDQAAYEFIANAIAVPQFDGFLLGWVTSSLQAPGDRYAALGAVGLDEMSDACAGFNTSEMAVFSRPVMTVLSIRAWLIPKFRVCYNNPLAPHNLEGYFLSAGDAYVMAGRFDVARSNYQNATRMPRYQQWPFRALLESRLSADLPALRQTFASQVALIDIPPGVPTTAMRSGHGCAFCHAETP